MMNMYKNQECAKFTCMYESSCHALHRKSAQPKQTTCTSTNLNTPNAMMSSTGRYSTKTASSAYQDPYHMYDGISDGNLSSNSAVIAPSAAIAPSGIIAPSAPPLRGQTQPGAGNTHRVQPYEYVDVDRSARAKPNRARKYDPKNGATGLIVNNTRDAMPHMTSRANARTDTVAYDLEKPIEPANHATEYDFEKPTDQEIYDSAVKPEDASIDLVRNSFYEGSGDVAPRTQSGDDVSSSRADEETIYFKDNEAYEH